MTTMLERIARSIYEKRNGAGCRPWTIQTKAHKAPYLDDARAAIEAMDEPTEAMIDAGRIAHMKIVGGYGGPSSWEAMLDAILAEHDAKEKVG